MSQVLRAVELSSGVTVNELMAQMNYRRGVIDKTLKLLEVDGAVVREGQSFIRTTNAWQPDRTRSEQVTANRRAELEEIKRYVDHGECLMEFLSRALDDPSPAPCGKCMNCSAQVQRQPIPQRLIREAVEFLRGDEILFEARKQWPASTLEDIQKQMPAAVGQTRQRVPSTRIPADLRPEAGHALCIYGDAGWGRVVADGKYQARHFDDELVDASALLIRDRWQPEPFPQWVTCVPSNRQPTLVSDFAKRLAAALNLPFFAVVTKIRDTQPQKLMENSAQQLRNLLGAFAVERDILRTPVLLVDDVIDSGWTLSTIAILLRMNGAGPVFPFALARATAGDS
jgi:ATP-dependent DNA helicase RecQ